MSQEHRVSLVAARLVRRQYVEGGGSRPGTGLRKVAPRARRLHTYIEDDCHDPMVVVSRGVVWVLLPGVPRSRRAGNQLGEDRKYPKKVRGSS